MGMEKTVALKLLGLAKIELIRRETEKNQKGKTETKKKTKKTWDSLVCDLFVMRTDLRNLMCV